MESYVPDLVTDSSLGEGTYRVGIDIDAGEYKLKSTGTRASASRAIVSNKLFEDSTYVTVEDGQYLKLTGCSTIDTSAGE